MNHQILNAVNECDPQKMETLLTRLQGTPILVLGDLLVDEYVYGRTERVSREAPVPIMVASDQRSAAGGAANAAAVAAALGGDVHAAGFVGDDLQGRRLLQILVQQGVNLNHEPIQNLQTAIKTRYLAGSLGTSYQQVLRVDQPLKCLDDDWNAIEKIFVKTIETLAPSLKGVLISDYGSGETHTLLVQLATYANKLGLPILVDSRYGIADYALQHAVLKPNAVELEEALGAVDLSQDEDLRSAALVLREQTGVQAVLATKGKQGMVWCTEEQICEIDVLPDFSGTLDVTGAGDGVAAVSLMGIANGLAPQEIIALATLTATYIVTQHGTACPSSDDLIQLAQRFQGQPS
jgi:D-glycero-beta-D-manno-heptose-7-phosphate kinase